MTQVCQGRKSVKHFERYNGLDTALFKNIPLFLQTDSAIYAGDGGVGDTLPLHGQRSSVVCHVWTERDV